MKKSFTIIGAGKLGTTLALLLKDNLIFDNFLDIEKNCNNELLTQKKIKTDFPVIDSDFIFLTVPDRLIKNVANRLKIKNNPLIIHCSGSMQASEIGLYHYDLLSMHPMMSIAYPEKAVEDFKNHFISLQGDEKAIKRIIPIMSNISNNYIILDEKEKAYFHLAAVFINNFTSILALIAKNIIKNNSSLKEKNILKILLPLLLDSYNNINYNKNIEKSLTGPIIRNDKNTIEKHLKLIKDSKMKNIYNSFRNYFK